MEFIEYPKAVYKEDDQRIVQDAAEEAIAKADGYGPWICKTLRANAAPQDNEQQATTEAQAPEGAAPDEPPARKKPGPKPKV